MGTPRFEDQFCIVVPAFNEALTIGRVVGECLAASDRVYVVDDGSSDDTARMATLAGATILRNESNLGLGASLRRGFRQALTDGFELVGTVDADGVHRPSDLQRLLVHHIDIGADLTLGSRAGHDMAFKCLPGPRASANRLVQLSLNKLLNGAVSDWLTGLRILGRRALEGAFSENGYAIAVELVARGLVAGWTIGEVQIEIDYGTAALQGTKRRELEDFVFFCSSLTGHQAFFQVINAVKVRTCFTIFVEGRWFECRVSDQDGNYVVHELEGLPEPRIVGDLFNVT